MTKFIFFILLIISSHSYSSDLTSFDYNLFSQELSDSVRGESSDLKSKLDGYKKILDKQLVTTPDNPWLYYAMGDLQWAYIKLLPTREFRGSDGKVSSRSPIDLEALKKQKLVSQKYYMQAFEYHINGSPKLKTKMLLFLQGFASDIQTKVDIHYAILSANEDQQVFGPNNSKLEFRRGIVRSMIKAGAIEMGKAEIKKNKKRIP